MEKEKAIEVLKQMNLEHALFTCNECPRAGESPDVCETCLAEAVKAVLAALEDK